MVPEQFERLCELFEAARTRDPEDQSSFLDLQCSDEPALRREVELLLEHDRRGHPLLDTPPAQMTTPPSAPSPDSAGNQPPDPGNVPSHIGAYRIDRVLGVGGMGVVYEAEQERPRRKVALKVLRPGLLTPRIIRRFEQEAQLLGLLRHPGIAQIYEAGVAETAVGFQPYFAMELVQGRQILEYAAAHELSARARLEIFVSICEAVHHAHQKGIVHRDLKPGNILVDESSREDDGPTTTVQPKILDFGVARVTDSDIPSATIQTDIGQLVGTIPYMSPEQVAGIPDQIDVRSDIYGLGVLCFELLSGHLPHNVRTLPVTEAVRKIAEDEPTSLASIDRTFRGDVDTIVGKALEKDRSRRYQSTLELAADVRRYLNDEPIVARPASALYQLRKFTRRNRTVTALVLGLFIALLSGVLATSLSLVEARSAAREAEALNEFLTDVLTSVEPAQSGRDVRFIEVIEHAEATLPKRFADQPELESSVRSLLGQVYKRLDMQPEAEVQLRRAWQLRREHLARDDPRTFDTGQALAHALLIQHNLDEAEALANTVLAGRTRIFGEADPFTLDARRLRADILLERGHRDEAERELRAALRIAEDGIGPDHAVTMRVLHALIHVLKGGTATPERLQETETLARRIVRSREAHDGPDTYITLESLGTLAGVLISQARFEEAETFARTTIERGLPRFGDQHRIIINAMYFLATALHKQDKNEEAADWAIRSVASLRQLRGDRHPLVLAHMSDTLSILAAAGRHAESEEFARVLLTTFTELFGSEYATTLRYRRALAEVLADQGKCEESEQHCLEVLAAEAHLDSDLERARIRRIYSSCLVNAARVDEAEARLREALALLGDDEGIGTVRERQQVEAALGRLQAR